MEVLNFTMLQYYPLSTYNSLFDFKPICFLCASLKMYFDDAKYVSSRVPEIISVMLQIRAEQIKLLGLLYYAFGERR